MERIVKADSTVAYPEFKKILLEDPPVRLLVLGDLILDRYLFGEVSRVSPEAPVPVLREEEGRERLGGAGNVLANLWGLGAEARGVGVAGTDPEGERLAALLGDRGEVVRDPSRPTTVKTRAVARGQQILRVDREGTHPLAGGIEAAVCSLVSREARGCQGIVISDYRKGVCTPRILKMVIDIARSEGIPTVVDPKGSDFSRYRGAEILTPNLAEAESALGVSFQDEAAFAKAAVELVEAYDLETLVVTRGADGISTYGRGGAKTHIPARGRAVYDVTGAGDTVAAAITLARARGVSLPEAVAFANLAAGVVVGKVGAVPVTREEILSVLGGGGGGKVLAPDELSRVLQERRARGERIVFTNGCFDILHVGHVRLMRFSRSLGECLVVGLNTDRSIRRGKGKERPVLAEAERAELVAGLDAVDYVTLFDEEIPERLIRQVRPDILVKGADYEGEVVVGREFVESYGGEVVLAPMVDGVSTTAIIERIRGSKPGLETR